MTLRTYWWICRGYFERDRPIFTLLLSLKIQMIEQESISQNHFNCLVKGGAALDITNVRKKPKDWISDVMWLDVIELSNSIPMFKDLPDSLTRSDGLWKQWWDQEAPESTDVPEFEDRLDPCHRMLLVRALRQDRTPVIAPMYVASTIGQKYVEAVSLNYESILEETKPDASKKLFVLPVLFVLSLGADPTESILQLAKKRKKEVKSVSMGQGQEVIARRLVTAGVTTGCWVLLQNTHLGLKFLGELEQTILGLEECHPDFRLYITSEPTPNFPIGLLQMAIKATTEPPVGMKAGLTRSFTWVNQDMVDAVGGEATGQYWRSMLYILCFLHSVVQERRKFGPIGFTVPYEFNQSDLSACAQFLQNHLLEMESRKAKEVTWSTVRYMISEIQYGGRVTDDWDRRLMSSYTTKYFAQATMEPGYSLFPGYKVPEGSDINVFRQNIQNIPLVDNPELFVLHANADLAYRLKQAAYQFTTILETQPKGGGGGGGLTREEIVGNICQDLEGKLPEKFKMNEAYSIINKMGGTNPINICFRQELERLQKVLLSISKICKNLQLAIQGTIVMSDTLIQTMNSLFDAVVPKEWSVISWAAPSVGMWFAGVVRRYEQWDKWLRHGRPVHFWIAGFFNPQGFLTAARQEAARKHNWALDDVVLYTEVSKMESGEVKEPPNDGVYLSGLSLEGAAYDKRGGKLVDAPPKILFNPIPVMATTAVLKSRSSYPYTTYECPVYKNKNRANVMVFGNLVGGQNLIFPARIKTDEAPQKWILRGVALLATTD